MKEGWVWDAATGEKSVASEEVMRRAMEGDEIVDALARWVQIFLHCGVGQIETLDGFIVLAP